MNGRFDVKNATSLSVGFRLALTIWIEPHCSHNAM